MPVRFAVRAGRKVAFMFAGATAFELLVLLLVVGCVAAICGYAGGVGARLTFAMRLDRAESYLLQLLNRSKGAAGQAVVAARREATSKADREAEALAAQLRSVGNARVPRTEGEWEQVARARGLATVKEEA